MQALIQSKEEDDDSKLDQAEALPPSAGEISTRDVPECSLSEEKSSNDIEEELTDCKKEDLHLENKITSSVDKVTCM